jgi:penicillin-binding protein 1A
MLAPVLAFCTAASGVGAMFLYYTFVFPDPLSMRPKESGPVIRILARDGTLMDERGGPRDYIPLDFLPRRVTDAVVATEDRRFYEHHGLDPVGTLRAFFANVSAGRFVQGGSTLTQQLAKNLFLSPERTLARKVEEVVLAFWLELKLSKKDILELYLNRVYFGGGAYGIEAAAQRYFGKSARELSLAEAAVVAGLLKAPSKYAPSASPVQALERGRSVLAKMQDAGFITEEQESEARRDQVRFAGEKPGAERSGVAYATDFVLEQLAQIDGSGRADITVETTVDAGLQRRASEIVSKEIEGQGEFLAASQGAAVVLDGDGAIRALVGGRSYTDSQFNRGVKARRQPGSAFKPMVYLTALEAGFTPDTVVVDSPLSVGGWAPRNENGRYVGDVTLRDALAHSINTVAVRLLLEVGASRVAATARRLGIRSLLRKDASLALGTSEVSLLELTGAYGAFANGGRVVEPYAIRRVRTRSGETIYTRQERRSEPVIAPKNLAQMNDMLQATLVSGTGRRAALPFHTAAGKTGTSQEFRDAWFVGYTAYLTGGVWVGNDNGQTMNKVKGGSLPADIWRQIMMAAHEGKPPLPLPVGPDLPVAGGAVPSSGAAHPKIPIGEDFISRALTRGTLERGDLESASHDADMVGSASIVVRPPGLMQLGRRQQ